MHELMLVKYMFFESRAIQPHRHRCRRRVDWGWHLNRIALVVVDEVAGGGFATKKNGRRYDM